MSTRVKSPKDTINIRRLPPKGATVQLAATVVRVAEAEGGHQGRVTLRIPGALAPITIDARFLDGDPEA